MNSTQYAYHPYPSPSQTQAQTPQQQQVLSPQQQHQQQVLSPLLQQHSSSSDTSSQSQQQLSPQQSPSSSHHQSPEQQHANHITIDQSHSGNSGSNSNNSNNNNIASNGNNSNSSNNGSNLIEQHSPSHSNDAQSPIDAEGELIITPGAAAQQQQTTSGMVSSALHSPGTGQSHGHTTLLPMPSPALAAATAANTAANTNPSANRQLILQHYQQQQQQQNQLQIGMSMSMSQASANGNNPGAINTMMSLQSPPYMLPSPQSISGQTSLPTLPQQCTDLDAILAKYANQPDLLKLIIASKTEEDRRGAEEARYRFMDLVIRGENRGLGLMAGYEALGGVPGNLPGSLMGMNAKRFMEEGGFGHHSMFGGFPPSGPLSSGGAGVTTGNGASVGPNGAQGSSGPQSGLNPSSTSTGSNSTGISSMYAQSPMSNPFAMNGMGAMGHGSHPMMNQTMGNAAGFNQYVDPSLARKRSVTFAGEVHHHMRSQSLSSIQSPNTTGQLGGMPMMGMGADTFAQQQQQQALQNPQQYQFQQHQHLQQQQQQMHYHHNNHSFGSGPYSQFPPQHPLPNMHHSAIRRTNSLSHITQPQTTITEQRLAAGRPRNDSSTSIRTMEDDSDEDSDEEYENHPMGMSSRPGSALSIHNNIGGTGETSLTLEFSDLASVSGGHGRHNSNSSHQDQGSSNNSASSSGIVKTHRSTSSTSSLSGATGGALGSDKRKRKRREMQPVNKIVDSPEPHVDPYLWKNNGNTTQKKTGCKSIYYKCSNSPAGCTVNKTVTEKEGGGYLTKYRGEHLEDCIRLKKAQQAAQAAQAAAQSGQLSLQKEQ
ncbi:hypothetical protein BGZ49_004846 [Haplosporangium sp. Z 27]|nr:hypothetical protein BGZ49_004846 [Haplosporangium sp. Z 27]